MSAIRLDKRVRDVIQARMGRLQALPDDLFASDGGQAYVRFDGMTIRGDGVQFTLKDEPVAFLEFPRCDFREGQSVTIKGSEHLRGLLGWRLI